MCFYGQMTLDSTTFYGYTVAGVVSIVGFVTEKQEGNLADTEGLLLIIGVACDKNALWFVTICQAEQRTEGCNC